ncbi:C40 family peptidase [Catenulispora rubra]|uniref:C40 family peptidase n=1 Tax=Catenulispora rubra TaxID=280293 RepID=UPI0018921C69|nr:NlpC/P60 family protein [Catenulispora rubra]
MQCHKPGHRASARCVSALLAAGALLAAAADHLGGTAVRPAIRTAALDVPSVPIPAPLPDVPNAVGAPVRPAPAEADPPTPASAPQPATRGSQPARPASRAAKTPAGHQSAPTARPKPASQSRPAARRPAPDRHANSYLLAHLPPAKNKNAAAAVHEALSLLGVPYRWGGTTRAGGFDCSGFTQHVWAAAGVKIPRTVRAQAHAGTQIPLSKVEPGDLVVFYPTQHHVGVYVGNGLVLDSPHSGSWVRPDPVRSMPVSVVVRVHA